MLRRKKVKSKNINRSPFVSTPDLRKSFVIDEISNNHLIRRLKVIHGLITDNISVLRDNKKTVNALNDRLKKVETKLVLVDIILFKVKQIFLIEITISFR